MYQTENASFSEWTVIENHPADSRVKVCEDGIFQTLPSRMGTGGGNVPMVMETRYARTQNQVLCLLQKTYGEKEVLQWGVASMATLQQPNLLRQRMHEKGIQSKIESRNKLDDSTLPCPELVAEWLLRDMWEQQKCGCSPQGRESAEQQFGQSSKAMSKLPYQSTPSPEDLFSMWSKGKGLWILQQTLSEIQKIWESSDITREGGDGMNDVSSVVRRLTPL